MSKHNPNHTEYMFVTRVPSQPQISVTFQNFTPKPIIWCRGPRPKAHWYMHTNGTNYRNVTVMLWVFFTCCAMDAHAHNGAQLQTS